MPTNDPVLTTTPAAACRQARQRMAKAQHHALDVRAQQLVQIVIARHGLAAAVRPLAPGVVEEEVDTAVDLEGPLEQPFDILLASHVGSLEHRPADATGQRARHMVAALAVPSRYHHVGAAADQAARHGAPYSGCAAGDHGHTTSQSVAHHVTTPLDSTPPRDRRRRLRAVQSSLRS